MILPVFGIMIMRKNIKTMIKGIMVTITVTTQIMIVVMKTTEMGIDNSHYVVMITS